MSPTTAPHPDRRKYPRIAVAPGMGGTLDLAKEIRLVNLSPGGAMIEHAQPLAVGQACVLDLPTPAGDRHLRAHVVWSRLYSVFHARDERPECRYRSGLAFSADLTEVQALVGDCRP